MQSQEHVKMPLQEQVKRPEQEPTQVCILPKIYSKNRSWAQMAIDEEEEEEQERLREEENKMKNIMAARRFLYSIGAYELEEGEILE